METKEIIFSKVDKSIKTMINKFRERYKQFVSENDLHCYLYHILYKNGINEFKGRLILHKEFPSCSVRGKGERKGLFDIVILDPGKIKDEVRESKVLIAMEFKLIKNNSEGQIGLIERDFKQIAEELDKEELDNKHIEKGYVFVFDQIDYKHKKEIIEIINKYKLVNGYYINKKGHIPRA